jgi:serine/threonine protein kinase
MITPDKTLKIADFGLAGALSSKKTAPEIENVGNERNELTYSLLRGKKAGTIGYMSPEQHIDAGKL